MTLKGLWVRGTCTVGIAVATTYEAAMKDYSDTWGFKEWNHVVVLLAIAFFMALRGFKDQSATEYKQSLPADYSEHIDAVERVQPRSKTGRGAG